MERSAAARAAAAKKMKKKPLSAETRTRYERAASERHAANGRLGKAAKMSGSVKHVTPTPDDVTARAEAEAVLTVEQVALREMRVREHGWVCALHVRGLHGRGQLHVFLAGDLGGGSPWIKKIAAARRKRGAGALRTTGASRPRAWW